MLSSFPQFHFFLIHLQLAFRNLLLVKKYIGVLPRLILFDLYAVFNIVDLLSQDKPFSWFSRYQAFHFIFQPFGMVSLSQGLIAGLLCCKNSNL